jgi:hypothetical protein
MAWRWNEFDNKALTVSKEVKPGHFQAEPETKKVPVSGYCKLIGE